MRGGYEKDLFGNPVPPPERESRATKPRQAGLSGNVQSSPTIPGDTPSPPGEYYVRTIIGSEVNRTLAADRIHSTADLAQATQYLYRSAVERFDGIVTDKDGRPLAVVGGFKGSIDSASVYPSTLVAEAVRVPDAANIWFSHNHPSGLSSLSDADKRLSDVLSDVFEGSGIEPRGLIAVGQGQFSDVDGYTGPIPASGATVTVPAIEREQEGEPTNITIESPGAARLAGAAYYKQEENPGILLLNTRYQVIGWVPISQPMIEGPLRHTGQLRAIYRAISESNSAAAILIHGGELDHVLVHADDAGGNIAAALYKAGVRPLDVLNAKTGESRAEKGRPITNSIMYRDGVAEEGATYGGAGLSKADAQDLTLRFVRDYPGALELAYRFRQNTTELYGSRADEVPASMKGGYVPKETPHNGRNYRGRIDIPLENMRDTRDLLLTLRHEVIGHYGVNTFSPEEKRALLDGLVAARNEPGIKPLWESVDRHYGDRSLDVRAEEVFALHCEGIAPRHHINDPQVADRGQRALLETCIERTRLMQVADLSNIACMVAQGLHDRSRTQQTFPQINELLRRDDTMEPKKPFHEVVAEKLIEQLKAGTAPWQRPWEPGEPNSMLPMNPTTGKRYKGINAIHLMAQGRSDSRWMTYKQAAAVGAQVRKGEKGTPIQYWKFSEEQTKLDDNGKPVLDAEGKPVKETVMLERPRVFFATVFNGEQIDGLPPIQRKEQTWAAIDRAEHILNASGADLRHGAGDRAFYRPATDSIHLPDKGQFPSADRYYATALHELGHWTGHPSRLNRDLSHPFGSEGYAKEELRAEIASMILGDELGIGHDPGQHAAYVGSWIKVLQDEPLEVFRAAADAEKIRDYVLAFEQKQVQEQGQQLGGQVETQEAAMHQTNTAEASRLLAAYSPEVVQSIEQAATARRQLAAGEIEGAAFAAATQQHLGVQLPPDWNGELRIIGVAEQDGQTVDAAQAGIEPQAYQVFARKANVQFGQDAFAFVAGTRTEAEAQDLADRLHMVDALGTGDEHERAAKLARLHEERVRRDPNATDEDISAAKEARKTAEAAALVNDAEAQRKAADQERERQQAGEKQYINVPYKEKDEAKALGARWDRQQQSWYVPAGMDAAPFAKWAQASQSQGQAANAAQKPAQTRQYLAVPYEQRQAAKAAGALWDKAAKSWYVGPKGDMEKLARWLPENVPAQQAPAMTPREEFAEAMRSAGLLVQGEHPIMDGKKHRVPVEGGKKGALDGFYVGHLDGHPAGRIINNKTGADIKWKSKGYSLSEQEKARLQAEAAEKMAQRAAEQARAHEATAQRVGRQMADLVPIEQPTPYLRAKGIKAHAGVFTDREGQKTYIPAYDASGKQWTMQYIHEDGTKRFAKGSRKEGCFHPVGGMEALAAAPALVISEGYATAATIAEALGFATVAAFDSGNLEAVAKALHQKFPDKPVIIAGDDDRHLVMTHGSNPGREKAEAAARAVGGKAIFPIFAPGESAYPSNLPPITPDAYKAHLRAEQRLADAAAGKATVNQDEADKLKKAMLSDAQLAALATMKQHTDFNDLAVKSELGSAGVKRQVANAVGMVMVDEGHRQKVEKIEKQQIEQRPRRAARIG